MNPFTRTTEAPVKDSTDTPAADAPEDTRVEELLDQTGFTQEKRDEVARLLAAALNERNEEDALRNAVPAIAAATGTTTTSAAHELAQAKKRRDRYQAFLDGHGLSDAAPLDRMELAKTTLEAIDRRRERLQARSKLVTTSHTKRLRIEQELDQLEELERTHFSLLHPVLIYGQQMPRSKYWCVGCKTEPLDADTAIFGSGYCPTCLYAARLQAKGLSA